jgi:alanyl-tRNA synthetase
MDVAFRVIADHIRTLSFAIADGSSPVPTAITSCAAFCAGLSVMADPWAAGPALLVGVLADTMGHVFPEVRAKQEHIEEVVQREEEAFNKPWITSHPRRLNASKPTAQRGVRALNFILMAWIPRWI